MALFNSIGKKLTNAGQNVAQQTKSFTETAKLNSQISTWEKKISELFLALGRACYERHRDDADAENRSLIEQINNLYAQIAEAQEQIKQIKGIEKCPQCGADMPKDALFCSACGARMKPAVQQVRFCIKCGAQLEPGTIFCTSCGTKVVEDTSDDTVTNDESVDWIADEKPPEGEPATDNPPEQTE